MISSDSLRRRKSEAVFLVLSLLASILYLVQNESLVFCDKIIVTNPAPKMAPRTVLKVDEWKTVLQINPKGKREPISKYLPILCIPF